MKRLVLIFVISLLSFYDSNAQNIININSSYKNYDSEINITKDFKYAKRTREWNLNKNLQNNVQINVNDTILLDLFSDKQYKAYIEKIEVDINGTLSVKARLTGFNYAYCFITTFAGKSFITIDIPENNEYYSSKYEHNTGKYYLLEIDKTKQIYLEGSPSIITPSHKQVDINFIKKLQKGKQDNLLNKDTIKSNESIINNPIIVNDEFNPDVSFNI